jgi:hypothetical protein
MISIHRFLQLALVVMLAVVAVLVVGRLRDAPREDVSVLLPSWSPAASTSQGDRAAPATKPDLDVGVGPAYPNELSTPPTADEGQSKLWFNDGTWWGALIDASTGTFGVYFLDPNELAWTYTGLIIDERTDVRVDVQWDGTHLYVASGGGRPTAEHAIHLTRYSYEPESRAYVVDPGFPVLLTTGGVSRFAIARDTADVMWIVYISDGGVWINHTEGADNSWGVAHALSGADVSVAADATAIIAYGGSIGVIWSSQAEGAVKFVSHTDGDPYDAWSDIATVLRGPVVADDHLSVRSLDGPGGSVVFVVVKTSADVLPASDPDDAQMLLLERRPDGLWRSHVYGRVEDRHTRPLVLVDGERRELYIFAVAPFGGGAIYYKQTPADQIVLTPGRGAPFIQLPDRQQITSPTSTKQNLSAATGLVVLAVDDTTNRYVHGAIELD